MKKCKTLIVVICTFLATTMLWFTVYNCVVMNNPIIKKVTDAYLLIEDNYIFDYDKEYTKDLTVAAMVMSLGDPYSQFFSREYYKDLQESMDGHYYGIGVMVSASAETQQIAVTDVTADSPAERAGIEVGDILIEVEGTVASYANYQEAVSLIKGGSDVEGKEVKLKLIRGKTGVEYTVFVKREKIVSHTVDAEMLGDGVAYIRISSFDNETQKEFFDAVTGLGAEKIKRLILDLRDNGGGTLYSTRTIADMLMPEAVLTTFKYKNGDTNDITTTKDRLLDVPVYILVNGNSASASEVLTSGLRDCGVATVFGEQTFGKAIAQQSIPFETENGKTVSSLYLTHASYLTPKGEDIHKKGITPDVIVPAPEEYAEIPVAEWERAKDTQLQAVLEYIKNEVLK